MAARKKKIIIVATLDTKGAEVEFIKHRIEALGEKTLVINSGVYPAKGIPADIDLQAVAKAVGLQPQEFPRLGKVGAMKKIAESLKVMVRTLFERGDVSAIVCLGGGVGMWIGAEIMRQLPVGLPKMIISPIPFRDIKPLLGTRDIILIHSVVDIAGLNPVLRDLLNHAAVSLVAMVRAPRVEKSTRKVIGLSVKGVTQKAGDNFRMLLEKNGFEVMACHASGMGGKALEAFMEQKMLSGVVELTTQEITGELLGGTTRVAYQRFITAGRLGIPQVICPGAIETISLGPLESLSDEQRARPHYCHSPSFTHIRISDEEMAVVVDALAGRLNRSNGPVAVMIPRRGFSVENIPGGKIYDEEKNRFFIDEIRKKCRAEIKIEALDVHIDDPAFAEASVRILLNMMQDTSDR